MRTIPHVLMPTCAPAEGLVIHFPVSIQPAVLYYDTIKDFIQKDDCTITYILAKRNYFHSFVKIANRMCKRSKTAHSSGGGGGGAYRDGAKRK